MKSLLWLEFPFLTRLLMCNRSPVRCRLNAESVRLSNRRLFVPGRLFFPHSYFHLVFSVEKGPFHAPRACIHEVPWTVLARFLPHWPGAD